MKFLCNYLPSRNLKKNITKKKKEAQPPQICSVKLTIINKFCQLLQIIINYPFQNSSVELISLWKVTTYFFLISSSQFLVHIKASSFNPSATLFKTLWWMTVPETFGSLNRLYHLDSCLSVHTDYFSELQGPHKTWQQLSWLLPNMSFIHTLTILDDNFYWILGIRYTGLFPEHLYIP